MRRVRLIWALVLAGLPVLGAKPTLFELRGRVEPPPGPAVAILGGVDSPYAARTLVGTNGEFTFKKLEQGSYRIWIFAPNAGEVEQTVAVGPGTADRKRRVRVTINFDSPEIAALKEKHTISVRDLSIPAPAKLDFVEAHRLLNRKDVEGARKLLLQAVERAPNFVAAWNELGRIEYLSKRYAEAEKYFRKAVELDPKGFPPVVNLGGVLLNLGRPEEALRYNSYALALRPSDALANAQMGLNYFMLGDYDKAIPHLQEARRRDPSHFSYPQITLATIYVRRGQYREAIQELEDFLARHPDSERAPKVREQVEILKRKVGAEKPD